MAKKSQDSMIKNLIRDYPVDALDFFEPGIIKAYGRPISVSFNIQEIKKHSHYDHSMKNDIAVTYTFANGKKTVLVLIEHWSDKSKFDIHRFAHYLIDLSKRFPDIDILPVALFTDRSNEWIKRPQSEIKISCMGETFLEFRYRLVRMKDHEAEKYRQTKNRFIAVMRSAMRCGMENKIVLAVEFLTRYRYIENDINNFIKNADIIEYFLAIKKEEKESIIETFEVREDGEMIVQELINRGLEKGKIEGMQLGIEKANLETARKMKSRGIDIHLIAEVTDIPEDMIEKLP